ncbi:hypothetical protein NXH56_08610, partial [Bifidobacterium thermophilum]|nr:hypothetical protein [Bifidobacterium thermophilum]
FVAVIYLTKYVYFGSLSVGVTLLIYALFKPANEHDFIFLLFLILLIFLHRSNIKNHLSQNEPKINDKRIKDDRLPPKNTKQA